MIEKQNSKGGVRKGAGRPPKDPSGAKEQASWWLSPDVLAIIRAQSNQTEFIEQAVREKAAR